MKGQRRRPHRPVLVVALAVAGMLALLLVAGPAQAIPRELRSSSRPWFATFGLGPAIRIDDMPTQMKLEQAIGYHFFGKGSGPALGGVLTESFGNHFYQIGIGLRFWWDIQPVAGLGLYLAPMMQIGWSLFGWETNCPANWNCDDTANYFDWQIGFEPRLVIGDRGIVFFRFVTLNPFFGNNVGLRYDLVFGGGVTF